LSNQFAVTARTISLCHAPLLNGMIIAQLGFQIKQFIGVFMKFNFTDVSSSLVNMKQNDVSPVAASRSYGSQDNEELFSEKIE
jgi:hypothetical protein